MGLPENFIITILLAVLVFPATISKAQDQNLFPSLVVNKTHFSYSRKNFTPPDYQFFSTSGDASINNGALQITPDSINQHFTLFNKSGRAMFRRSFKLWEINDDRILSFNSTFLINVFPAPSPINTKQSIPGEGLTFVIAPDLQTPPGSDGGYLGLTNRTHDGNPSNRFIAIELDTVKEDFDPNGNHMGLNINSVVSKKTVNLSDYNIEIAPGEGKNYTVWIQYSGISKLLDVYMVLEGEPKPNSPFLSEKINLREYLNQYSYFGFSGSTGDTAQLNCILKWDLTVEIFPEDDGQKNWFIYLVVGIPVVVLSVILVVGLGYSLHKWRVKDDLDILVALKNLPGVPKEFMFKELKEATNNFDESLKLGQGGFGVVYKGVLPGENTVVAVKKFSRDITKSKFDFLAELTIINRLRHRHLVRLVGWCHKKRMLLLVYVYMPNHSLDGHLYGRAGETNTTVLGWENRYKITLGVASALNYLHNEYETTVVHGDLKASNIMLDSDFNARLGDFGLARAIDNERTSYAQMEGMAGTRGYIAPECFHTERPTKESDVFGFGAVVLEIVCGKRPWIETADGSLVDRVWKLHGEGRILDAVDTRLSRTNVDLEVQAKRLLLLGLACSNPIASERPKTQIIFQIISGSAPVPFVPSVKPRFVWHPPTDELMSVADARRTVTNIEDETPQPMASAYHTSYSVFVPTTVIITNSSDSTTFSNVNNVVTVKLTSSNYQLWRSQFMVFIRGNDLLRYVDGSTLCPTRYVQSEDQMLLSCILATLSESVHDQVIGTTTSRAAWIKLEQAYESRSQAPIMQLRMQLHTTKKGSMSSLDYLVKMQSFADSLAAVGHPVNEDELILHILSGLGPEYGAFVMALITCHESIKFVDVQRFLLDQEAVQLANEAPPCIEYNGINTHRTFHQSIWHWLNR